MLNVRDDKGAPPFHTAAHNGHENVLDLLLQYGMCIQVLNFKSQMIYKHVYIDSTDANLLSVRDEAGATVLHNTALGGHVHVMDWLFQRGMCVYVYS